MFARQEHLFSFYPPIPFGTAGRELPAAFFITFTKLKNLFGKDLRFRKKYAMIPVAFMKLILKGERGEYTMKEGLHPKYEQTTIRCACGNVIETGSTKKDIRVEVCSKCHPFYTGKQKMVDTGGRVSRFNKKFGLDK